MASRLMTYGPTITRLYEITNTNWQTVQEYSVEETMALLGVPASYIKNHEALIRRDGREITIDKIARFMAAEPFDKYGRCYRTHWCNGASGMYMSPTYEMTLEHLRKKADVAYPGQLMFKPKEIVQLIGIPISAVRERAGALGFFDGYTTLEKVARYMATEPRGGQIKEPRTRW